jgi:hypothetical protein
MSIRETVIEDIIDVLKDMNDPKPILVTREPFDVEKLAVTQFPAILVQSGQETRSDFAMNVRQGQINYNVRAFVRGTELDKKKNDIVERIEETLELNRRRNTGRTNLKTQVVSITPIDRLAPLGEVSVTVQVTYNMTRGVT